MEHMPRIYYSDAKKALMWERWRRGESLHNIAILFDRHHSSVRAVLSESGGIQPVPRRRSERVSSVAEREEISRGGCREVHACHCEIVRTGPVDHKSRAASQRWGRWLSSESG